MLVLDLVGDGAILRVCLMSSSTMALVLLSLMSSLCTSWLYALRDFSDFGLFDSEWML